MRVMTTQLPNLQQIEIGCLGERHKFSDGEDPHEEHAARTANLPTHDIEIISNFSKLRILKISSIAELNGRYPFLFSSFPLLEILSIHCKCIKWDLGMLAGFPLLKELDSWYNHRLISNINSLRVLKDTLELVEFRDCSRVEGNFMDLANFPNLKKLYLLDTAVTGDIRDIGEHDFSSLDAPKLVRALNLLQKHRPALKMNNWLWCGKLSEDSPDWYECVEQGNHWERPPFYVQFVKAGSRFGYQWTTCS